MKKELLSEVQLFNILCFIAIIFTVVIVACATISYSKIVNLKKHSVLTADELESFLRYPLFVVDNDQAVRIAETFLLSGEISGIVIETSASGNILSREAKKSSYWVPKITRELYQDEFLLGTFTITFDDAEIYRNIQQLSVISLIIVFAVFTVFNSANRYFIANRISRTFEPILSGFSSFSNGNYDTIIKPTRYTDVNIIVDYFNDMAKKIRQKNAEQKKSQEQLIAERRYWMDIIDFLPDATLILDTEKKVVAWNRAAEAMTSVPRDNLIGKGNYEYSLPFYHERRPILIDYLDSPHDGNQPLGDYESFKRTNNTLSSEAFLPLLNQGQGAHIWFVAAALFDQEGNRTGAIEVVRDVSEYKEAEREKHQLQRQLQQAQKMEAIGTLAGGIAHDFNNILAAIIGYVELAIFKMDTKGMEAKYMDGILKAANRAKNLVQQILAFSRQTKQTLKPVSVTLATKEALNLLRASLPSSIEIRQQFKSDSLVMGDTTQIHQILMNLCTNAAHAIPETGGTIDVEIVDVELDEASSPDFMNMKPGNYLLLTVSDTGSGIPQEIMERIFDPFFTTKAIGEGTGMGLSVIHGIVESFGGKVKVHSEPGKGTRFQVILPVVSKSVEPEQTVMESLPKGTERILFVDDEPALIDIGKKILETLGYTVTATTQPAKAVEFFQNNPDEFDLLITDMTMPKKAGDTLAREIFSFRPDLPVILCTGFSAGITEEKARAIGIKAIFKKPISWTDIARLIRNVLDENNTPKQDGSATSTMDLN